MTSARLIGDPHGPRAWTPAGSRLHLRESLWTRTEGGIPDPAGGLQLLESRLQSFAVRDEHLIPDSVLCDLAVDVRDQVQVVTRLIDSPYRRALFANARAAFESAIDAIALTDRESEYDRRGADAYVFGMFEIETLGRRIGAEDTRVLGHSEGLEKGIAQEVAEWNAVAPGKGSLLRQAFEQLPKRLKSGPRHWSGRTNEQLYELVTATLPAGTRELARTLDGLYGLLSMHTHPRPRFGQSARGAVRSPGPLEGDELDMVNTTAWVALVCAVRALDARWRFRT